MSRRSFDHLNFHERLQRLPRRDRREIRRFRRYLLDAKTMPAEALRSKHWRYLNLPRPT